jgi:tryptophan halogenase
MAEAIRTVCVLGGGIVGVTAALAFARGLPRARVTIIETPLDPAALADRMPGSLPAIAPFHAWLGIDERELVASGAATHRLATRFERWSADGAPWYHAYGDYGLAADGVPFHQVWAAARQAKRALPFHAYSAAAALAQAGRFVHPEADPGSPLSTYDYALRLDPQRYRERIAAHAGRARVERLQGEYGGVEQREDGAVAALLLKDGRRLEADLFLDCAGPAAPLLSSVSDAFEDWGDSLPCDRLLLGTAPALAAPSMQDIATATSVGWRWASPLPDRVVAGLAYNSAITGEGRARRVLASEAGVDAAEAVSIRPGRRPEAWVRNVLALGDAAVALDPLESTNLSVAHSAIRRALALIPGRDFHPLELAEYNRQTIQQTDRIRDFLALHYLRAPPRKGEFWQAVADRALPASLARTVEQFEARGRLPFFEEESFDKHSWLAVFLGMGIVPRALDPSAGALQLEPAIAGMERLAANLAALPARLPPYQAYLARMIGS